MLEGFFNATSSFREDADIFIPFGKIVLKPEYQHMETEGRWIEKIKPKLTESYKMKLGMKKRYLFFLLLEAVHVIPDLFCL